MVEEFYQLFFKCDAIIPCSPVFLSSKDKPWITPVLKCLINKRWAAFRDKKWTLYNHYKDKVKKQILEAKRIWAKRQSATTKGLWSVVNELSAKRCQNGLATLSTQYGSSERLVRDLTDEFLKNFNYDSDVDLLPINCVDWDFQVSHMDVLRKLQKLNPRKAMGPDMIPTKLLKLAAPFISYPLADIYNRSIIEKKFPVAFKHAHVTPLPKVSRPTVKDFRPISMLPVLGKILEQLVLDKMRNELTTCYSPRQHAYRPQGSTTTALVDIHDTITRLLDTKTTTAVRILCIDLSKAFDCLQINRLINYLASKGVCSAFLEWLLSYLTGRSFRVSTMDVYGPCVVVPSGVPQGSVLGPTLFAAFMGSISFSEVKDVTAVLYADDVTFIENFDSSCCSKTLLSLNYIEGKFKRAGLKLNTSKCKDMVFARSTSFVLSDGQLVSDTDVLRILGIRFSQSLSWSNQFSYMLKRASSRMYIIRCLRNVLTRVELIRVYHAIITSLFLYASPVYGCVPTTLLAKLDSFQKRAHKLVCGEDCLCPLFPPSGDRFRDAGLKLLHHCEAFDHHPLHARTPLGLPRSGHLRVPMSCTSRRQKPFFP